MATKKANKFSPKMFGPKNIWGKRILLKKIIDKDEGPKILGPKSLVKMVSITAETSSAGSATLEDTS